MDHHQLTITLPGLAPDKNDSVIALELDGDVQVDTALMQQPGDLVTLPAFLSKVHKSGEDGLRFDTRGVAERWVNKDEWLEWDFKITKPGDFDVVIVTSEQKYGRDWEGGHVVSVDVAGTRIKGTVENQSKEIVPANPYWPYVTSKVGRVTVDKPGKFNLALRPEIINSQKKLGLTLVSVRLVPVKK